MLFRSDKVTASGIAEPVYNLWVADHHTYFVGSQSWEFAVWTHNLYGEGFYADHPFHFLIRDNTSSALLFMGRINDPTQAENEVIPVVERVLGDSNGDNRFDSADLVLAFQAGKYEDGVPMNADWQEGDWNGDREFDSSDLVFAFQNGNYVAAATPLESRIASAMPADSQVAAAVDWLFLEDDSPHKRRAFVS